MIKKLILAASLLGCTAAPAYAGTLVATPGSVVSFAAPAAPGGATFNFNSAAVATGFTATYSNASLQTGDTASSAQPAFSDGSQYLAVIGGGVATIQSATRAFDSVSFFLGSIDTYNTIEILSTSGAVLASYTGGAFTAPFPADGNQDISVTNRRITWSRGAADAFIGGIRFSSTGNAAEVDNLVFAVPEPSTWMLMMAGFGMIGLAMRSRRRRANVVFA